MDTIHLTSLIPREPSGLPLKEDNLCITVTYAKLAGPKVSVKQRLHVLCNHYTCSIQNMIRGKTNTSVFPEPVKAIPMISRPDSLHVHTLNIIQYTLLTTVEPLLKDTLNKEHNTFNLSITDKFCGPYWTMAIQFIS